MVQLLYLRPLDKTNQSRVQFRNLSKWVIMYCPIGQFKLGHFKTCPGQTMLLYLKKKLWKNDIIQTISPTFHHSSLFLLTKKIKWTKKNIDGQWNACKTCSLQSFSELHGIPDTKSTENHIFLLYLLPNACYCVTYKLVFFSFYELYDTTIISFCIRIYCNLLCQWCKIAAWSEHCKS